MKYLLLLSLLPFMNSGRGDSYDRKYQPALVQDSIYIVIYTPGPGWDNKKAPQEQLHFAGHSRMLSSLRKEGRIKIGGRYSDKGMILLQAGSLQNARNIIYGDSTVIDGVFQAELYSFSAFYKGCIE